MAAADRRADIEMPSSMGVSCAPHSQAGWAERPLLIALTGWTSPQDASRVRKQASDHYMIAGGTLEDRAPDSRELSPDGQMNWSIVMQELSCSWWRCWSVAGAPRFSQTRRRTPAHGWRKKHDSHHIGHSDQLGTRDYDPSPGAAIDKRSRACSAASRAAWWASSELTGKPPGCVIVVRLPVRSSARA
jgi:hypothetical protein